MSKFKRSQSILVKSRSISIALIEHRKLMFADVVQKAVANVTDSNFHW